MEHPIPLESLFKEKLFRIPDYQRGYAWQRDQLRAFWEDLVNLAGTQMHYTGVLTLMKINGPLIAPASKEFWLVDDHSYHLYHVVDGQQRLTTFVVFIQAFADYIQSLPDNAGKSTSEIYVTDSLALSDLEERYLYRTNPKGGYRTYVFGYTEDNPSDEYFRFRILAEQGGRQVQETFYTLNLENAKLYFVEQISGWHAAKGVAGLADLFKRLTKRLLFNEYIIDEGFDVFVAFETMNNRGKKLSDLELLKNRLIYLTTLYDNDQADEGGKKALRDLINSIWREVYHQLGRNKAKPLNDDDFLRAHWISYFQYSRDTGRDYAKFLLDEHFTPRSVHEMIERDVCLEAIEEQRSEGDADTTDDVDEFVVTIGDNNTVKRSRLPVREVRDYVVSLGESAGHWFNSFYPHLATAMSDAERSALDRLNRIGMGYFRPLVMVVLKSVSDESERLAVFAEIERFIFIAFRIGTSKSNYRSSEFYRLARALNRKQVTVKDIKERLNTRLAYLFDKETGTLRIDEFYSILVKKFDDESGYYGWAGLRYFLYEYEHKLLKNSRQPKVGWNDLLKSSNDRISIEHIYPQTPIEAWETAFIGISERDRKSYGGALGNLLLLSMSINASLQNDAFVDKKKPKYDVHGRKTRNGYSDGSHSE
ncbi:MAG: DUF262 domain-containing protein, partial [Burkholderiaceae bacterium]|nr:DUF262 domain-containing protein [Burkholderiaceae bacterium]